MKPLLALPPLLLAPAAARAAGTGMPQIDFANPLTIAQVVWGTLIFIVLYMLLSRWGLPQVEAVLAQRSARITADLDAARGAKAGADAAVAELTVATREAQASAQAEIAQAVATAKAAADAEAAVANARLETQLAAAEQQISQARVAALGALEQVASATANEVVWRLTGSAIEPAAVDRAVADVLAARAK
jgi:F-type H+-transporting ATPase subunit b